MSAVRPVGVGTWRSDEMSVCPFCGYQADSAGTPDGDESRKPQAGDGSLCFGCGSLNVYTGQGLRLRAPTDEERAEMEANPVIMREQARLRRFLAAGLGPRR
jgi:hypothetical protein